jgi:hypothetical protein
MKSSEPPALATWLLEHIRFSSTHDALAGDLHEDFRRRRSVAWYWRQVLAAILVSFGNEVRTHRVLAIRTSLIGLAISSGTTVLGHFVFVALHQSGVSLPRIVPWFLTSFVSGVISGWLVAVLCPRHRAAMLPTFAAALLMWAAMGRGVIRVETDTARFVALAFTDYVFVLTGVVVGFLVSCAPKSTAPGR